MIRPEQIPMPFMGPPPHPFAHLIGVEFKMLGVNYVVVGVERTIKSHIIARAITLQQDFTMQGKRVIQIVEGARR